MADPLTAIGLAGNIVQFVGFCGSLLSKSRELYQSADGALLEYLELEAVTVHLDRLIVGMLRAYGRPAETETEKQLEDLCRQCRAAAQELLSAVDKLKVNVKSGKWKSFRQALNTIWSSDRIHGLSTRLEAFKRQIDTTLLVLIREQRAHESREHIQQLEKISGAITTLGQSTKKWQKDLLEQIQRHDWNPKNTQDMAALARQLTNVADTDREQKAMSNIMHLLDFYERGARQDMIKDAHAKTFEWIFDKKTQAHFPNGKVYYHSFNDWMRSDDNLYWVTGKPGSGKSTLMKYIDNDHRTNNNILVWASGKTLIRAGWFFWNSGTAMQMSRKGLLQALLYQCLDQRLDLLPQVFPHRWKNHELFGTDLHPFTWHELSVAISRLINIDKARYRFFFIIDGLDEFDGEVSDLIIWIKSTAASSNVKICVASRPWLAFEEAFDCHPSLQLHCLTFADIKQYATDNLLRNTTYANWFAQNTEMASTIVQMITGKACGVFLWVYLVVSSLLVGLRDGDRPEDLLGRIEELPSELKSLFKKILDNLNPEYFQQASHFIQIVKAAQEPLSLLELDFAEHFDMALRAELRPLTPNEITDRVEFMRRRLLSRCKGLLETRAILQQDHTSVRQLEHAKEGGEVSFLHRTVKDFLATKEIWDYIQSGMQETFDPNRSLCGMCIYRLKTMPRNGDETRNLWRVVPICMRYAKQYEESSEEAPILILEAVDSLASWILDGPQEIIIPAPNNDAVLNSQLSIPIQHWTKLSTITIGDAEIKTSCQSIFDYALNFGLYHYIDNRLRTDISVTYQLGDRSLLSSAIDGRDIELIKLLLSHGADPNERPAIASTGSPWYDVLMKPEWDRHWNSDTWVWLAGYGSHPPTEKETKRRNETLTTLAQIVEALLLRGADPWITIPTRYRVCDLCRQVTTRAEPYNAGDLIQMIFSEWSIEQTNKLLVLLESKQNITEKPAGITSSKGFFCLECQHRVNLRKVNRAVSPQIPTTKEILLRNSVLKIKYRLLKYFKTKL